MAQNHHAFRLPGPDTITLPKQQRCSAGRELTVCAPQGDGPRLTGHVTETAPPRHHTVLRIAPSRCANPVEDGLRCVRPTALARVNLGD
ncbi:hypothetical protein [Novosphingobium jiangmenense]|uniref:Uncharacterized protein n=1 Tax=Novosphingobium jiangmenense TaxID=2791981 RepID=A0ABS0HE36_9SPHN|nr:hypothetical protein [Novosphingobium jiangmenense]MBF9150476.1 hypothetical protein [Novosphingobium jiangmenense]